MNHWSQACQSVPGSTYHFDDIGGVGSDGPSRVLTGWWGDEEQMFSPTSCMQLQQVCGLDVTQVDESEASSAHRGSQLPGLPAGVGQHLPRWELLRQLPLRRSPASSACCSARSGHLENTVLAPQRLENAGEHWRTLELREDKQVRTRQNHTLALQQCLSF